MTRDDVLGRRGAEVEEQLDIPGGQEKELSLTLESISQVKQWDPQMMRALWFQNAPDDVIEPYKNILTHIKCQLLPITMFFSRAVKQPLPTPRNYSAKEGNKATDKDTFSCPECNTLLDKVMNRFFMI